MPFEGYDNSYWSPLRAFIGMLLIFEAEFICATLTPELLAAYLLPSMNENALFLSIKSSLESILSYYLLPTPNPKEEAPSCFWLVATLLSSLASSVGLPAIKLAVEVD